MTNFDPSHYPAACPHDPIREVAPDIFFAGGSIRMKPLMHISRNMVIVRTGEELTLVNPVRLSPQGEAELEALGTVGHCVRLGPFHGIDDPYTAARFNAKFWCQRGSTNYPEPTPDHVLEEGAPLPIPDAELIEFRETKKPECMLLIKRGEGVLLTCDGLQHYGDFSRQSLLAKIMMPLLGFSRSMLVGPMWLKAQTRPGSTIRPDFERLLEIEFDACISAHGTPLMHGAKDAIRAAIERAQFSADKS